MVFLWVNFNDPLAFMHILRTWGREFPGPVRVIYDGLAGLWKGDWLSSADFNWTLLVDLLAITLVLGTSIAVWRRLGESYALYCLLCVLIPAATTLTSMSRYVLVAFPMFMLLGWWGRIAVIDRAITVGFSLWLGVLMTIFVNWYFVA